MHIHRQLKDAFPDVPDAGHVSSLLLADFKDKLDANDGGMKLLGAISLVQCLAVATPRIYVELGAWKGVSTLIAKRFLQKDTKVFVFDPSLHWFNEKIEGACFSDQDWATPAFMSLNETGTSFLFADDHQDVIERLVTAWIRGYNFVLFDDDYAGRADHRTFRNFVLERASTDAALAGVMEVCIEKLVLLTQPEVSLPDSVNLHWRDQAFIQLKRSTAKGWTMGAPLFKKLSA